MGFRFRVHQKSVEGNPDIVLARHRTVIFVHGCFWHRHKLCGLAYVPKSRVEFWAAKFSANVLRDRAVSRKLKKQGWRVLVVWECELRDLDNLSTRLKEFLRKTY